MQYSLKKLQSKEKNGRSCREIERPETLFDNGKFPAKTGELESLLPMIKLLFFVLYFKFTLLIRFLCSV